MKWSRIYNPPMKWLLRSPLHFFVSKMYLLVTFTGRKSGTVYSTPVEYCSAGDRLLFFTARERVWWRNLSDGATITVHVQGKAHPATTQTSTGDPAQFETAFRTDLQRYPGREKYFNVRVTEGGSFNPADLQAAADKTVTVHITLNS